MRYDPLRPLVDQLVPRGDGSGMNKAFEFATCGVAVSVQASRYCRCTFVSIADSSTFTQYPFWTGLTPEGGAIIDKTLWTPVEFEVAMYNMDPFEFINVSAYHAKFGHDITCPELYAEDAEFRETGIANFVPLHDVEALLGLLP